MAAVAIQRRETVVYHQVDEETPLVSNQVTKSSFYTLDKPNVPRQKTIYSAITLADIFQKVVFTTILASFVVFAWTNLNLKYENSLVAYYIFTISTWLTISLMNLIVEKIFDKKKIIAFGFIIYFAGIVTLSAVTANLQKEVHLLKYLCIIPFTLICLGESICKTFIVSLSQGQFVLSETLRMYTTKLYWIGHTAALLLIAFFLGIIEFANYEIALGLCCVCLCAGFLSFCVSWNRLTLPARNDVSGIKLLFEICKNARSTKKSHLVNNSTHAQLEDWIDYAQISKGGKFEDAQVIEAKSFFKLAKMFAVFIPYWITNSQTYSTFVYQGFHLNKRIGSVIVPVTWVPLVNILSVLVFAKVLEKAILPGLWRKQVHFSSTWRITLGMLCAAVSMVLAGSVQLYAHNHQPRNINSTVLHGVNVTDISNVHILWTVPQHIFLGMSEVLVCLTGLGFACKLCPGVFKHLVVSVYYLMVAIGNLMSLLILLFGWFPRTTFFRGYELVIYFFTLAGTVLCGAIMFQCIPSKQTVAVKVAAPKETTDQL